MSDHVSKIAQAAVASSPPSVPKPDLPGALQFLREHPYAIISEVAKAHFVNRHTLTNYWKGRNKSTVKENSGKNKLLNREQIQAVFLYIENQVYIGFSISCKIIQGIVRYILS